MMLSVDDGGEDIVEEDLTEEGSIPLDQQHPQPREQDPDGILLLV